MAFSLPNFNLLCQGKANFNFNLGLNPVGPFILPNTPCNLCIWKRNHGDAVIIAGQLMYLLLPAGTAFKGRESYAVKNGDAIEVPMGSGRWYSCTSIDSVGLGFPNAHEMATLVHPYPTFATAPLWP
jgi:hypothetical protein